MRVSMLSAACVLLLVAVTSALPVSQPEDVVLVEVLPAQETLHSLDLGEPRSDSSANRDKRTIGFLRETFPTLSEIIDRKIQTITRFLFRVIGRLVLGGGGGGGGTDSSDSSSESGASTNGGNGGRKISITLPTYPPSLDDDEDEEDESAEDSNSAASNDVAAAASEVVIASTVAPVAAAAAASPARRSDSSARRRVARAVADQTVAASEPLNDQDTAADDAENRDKRFLFGFGGGEGGSSIAGSAGGSGNFLFDIIRLIAGSGTTEEHADAGAGAGVSGATGSAGIGYSAGAAAAIGEAPEVDGVKDDGYTSGIPGPITRLFIIANRGISNLLQDLILRLAQTSERVVNFKARLITSII